MIGNFAVTYKCNSRCKTCNIWQITNPEKEELSLQEIKNFLETNYNYLKGLKSIQLTGGEPYLRQDLPEITEQFNVFFPDIFIWIPTNGMNPDIIDLKTFEILKRTGGGNIGVSISVDGIKDTHDEQRGVKGSYDNCIKTIRKLSYLKKSNPSLSLSVGMTLTPINYKDTLKVYKLAKTHRTDFSLRPVNFSDIYYRNVENFNLKENLDEIAAYLRIIARDVRQTKGLSKSLSFIRYLRGVLDYIESPSNRTLECYAGEDSVFINPYGDVYPCIMMNEKLGNIRKEKLEKIMNSNCTKNVRERIKNLECVKCWVECEAYRDISHNKLTLIDTFLSCVIDKENLGLF
jgi:MoaA/NifB/PqqE/SkfB family radical SAM enzyme